MNPATITLIISLIEEAIKDAPELVTELKALFSRTSEPTASDWMLLKQKVASKSYEDYVNGTSLPKVP